MTSPVSRTPIITLTTDFGARDHYTASLKGAILSLNRVVRIVDISHEIPPMGIVHGGFVLACALPVFPPETIHVLVVDPGVGTSRRLLLARTENHILLAPDNGALGLVFEQEAPREVYNITASRYFRKEVSPTFHGRDILAPVAAQVSLGTPLACFGEPLTDWIPSPVPPPTRTADGQVLLQVLHVDRFGSVILNLRAEKFEALRKASGGDRFAIEIGRKRVERLLKTYHESAPGEPFALFNSCGYLELAVRNGSAAATLSAAIGEPAHLSL